MLCATREQIIMASWKPEPERLRLKFSKQHLQVLEELYTLNQYPNTSIIYGLSHDLGIEEKRLKQWFISRRKKKNVGHSKSTAPSTATRERKLSATRENKENTSHNASETREEVRVNQINEADVFWDPEKARDIMQQMIPRYKGLCPPHVLQAHFDSLDDTETQRKQSAVRRSEESEMKNGCNNENSQAIYALSSIVIRENQKDTAHNASDTREEVRIQKKDVLSWDPVRAHGIIKQIVSQYKGLCPPHLLQAHFIKQNLNKDRHTGNEITPAEHMVPGQH